MYIGVMSKRYATALWDYARERGEETAAYGQTKLLLRNYSRVQDLRSTVENPMVDEKDKLAVLKSAAANDGCCKTLADFFSLVLTHKREKLLVFILHSFLTLYEKEKQIRKGRLVTAIPVPEQTVENLKEAILKMIPGKDVDFDLEVDPDIIGGCILDVDFMRADACVASQLQSVKNQFIEKNRRIV